ncbi:PKD domain-containing protein [Parasediminibacterium paludis]|jgi:hypothetical protein|uniref:PKD domain-containing protein n=1 Tax=Parasediminibacterium paludis TaxID=908966 RepID=A0ABV8PVU9_9BACT
MKKYIKYLSILVLVIVTSIIGCKKTEYSFGSIKTPTNLTVTTAVQGASTSSPNGDGSGIVTVTANATDAIQYKIFFGNGDSVLTPYNTANYKYTKLDTNVYNITVTAIGTGGASTTATKQVKVLYTFAIPSNIVTGLTNGTSKVWKIAKDTVGHFGVGPLATFTADYYKAGPNEKPACAYASTITFTSVGNGITVNVNNFGSSFLINAALGFYGQAGGSDGCYPVATGGTQNLSFGNATSGSNTSNSTGIQFSVPGNGILNFGTGGTTYEILYLSSSVLMLRNVGIDGNAWYQIFKAQ